ncbi:MAG TPA: hypothetical protein VHO70_22745 [Chitinispirillaceae bacterium]|nr:hypothetical protein [Chitinispirillaceae bacterium]
MNNILVAVLLAASVVSAAETTQAPAVSFTPYGLSQFRFRYDITSTSRNNTTTSTGNYSNRLGYKFGVTIKAGDQTTFQFEIGNDWTNTEEVTGDSGVYKMYRPYVHLASVNWNPGYMHIMTGIIPIKNTPMLDLIGRSIDRHKKNYAQAGHINWSITTDNSLIGLNAGAPILSDDFKLGIEFTTAVLESRPAKASVDDFRTNASAVALMLGVPMSTGGVTINPQFIVTPGRNYSEKNDATKNRDPEIGGGLDFLFKLSDNATLNTGIGAAHISNKNSRDSITPEYRRTGVNAAAGTAIKLGPGKLNLDFVISFNKDSMKKDSLEIYPFVDLKYGWNVNKYFTIMPRFRGFWFIYPDETVKTLIRPEIIFTGSF